VTPREAIIELNRYIGTEKVSVDQKRLNQALRLAIKALRLMIELEDKPEALKKAESILPPIEEMRYLTEEERAEFNKYLEEISEPIIGVDGKPVNINDVI
jgi:hypothetical protein